MRLAAQDLKDALDTLLVANEGTSFAVIGARQRSHDAEVIKLRSQVTTYIDSGDFPKGSGSSISGPYQHEVTIKIELLATAAAKVDLSVLKSESATADEIAAALAAATTTTAEADAKYDALFALIWDLIMRPQNKKLGLDYNPRRWITHHEKNAPSTKGALAIVSGSMTLTATVVEYPTSETPVAGSAIDGIVKLSGDPAGTSLDSACQGVKEGT